jgi:hypothetical protein
MRRSHFGFRELAVLNWKLLHIQAEAGALVNTRASPHVKQQGCPVSCGGDADGCGCAEHLVAVVAILPQKWTD